MNTFYFILIGGGSVAFICWCLYTIFKAIKPDKPKK